jgi:predicted RNA binding protein YcfA (HicA-like mRNA interferase family)
MRRYSVREVIWALEHNGWVLRRQKGDHRQYRCKGNPFVITVAGHKKDIVPIGIVKDIERDSGLRFCEIYG